MMDAAQTGARSLAALREHSRLGTLSPLVAAVMADVDPDWALSRSAISWNAFLAALDCFVLREGHARVPRGHFENTHPLGERVHDARKNWKSGSLSAARAEQVSGRAGWAWNARDPAWDDFLAALDCFVLREGHSRVPTSHFEGEYPIGSRVSDTRKAWKSCRLSAARAEQVSSRAGWAWNVIDAAWGDFLAALDCFVAREGHSRVPTSHFEGTYPLGPRVSATRVGWRAGNLSTERAEQVSGRAGWVWNVIDAAWVDFLTALDCFVLREGHARVPARHFEDEYPLGSRVSTTRKEWKAARLSSDRVEQLSSRQGWTWEPPRGGARR